MSEPVLLVDPTGGLVEPFTRLGAQLVRTEADAAQAFDRYWRGALWIATRAAEIGRWAVGFGERRGDQRLLVLGPPRPSQHDLLRAVFRIVVAAEPGAGRLLPVEDLAEVLAAPDRRDLLIGGVVDRDDRALVLYRGDLDSLVMPLSWFADRPDTRADPGRFEVTDCGQTVRLGDYEAAVDAILYERDAVYRRREKRRRIEEERSFGGALRRLRLQRGLSRKDFPGLSEKEIARLERGEVKRPHAATRALLAQRLGVAPADIATY